jgi:hypothetical protein
MFNLCRQECRSAPLELQIWVSRFANPEGIYFYLGVFINTDTLVNCSTNEFFIPVSGGNFGGRTSFLLAAKTSGKRVQVTYYECSGSRIMAASVVVNWLLDIIFRD